jgi:glycine/D-amino acid oxidase-like deaminating enzyme
MHYTTPPLVKMAVFSLRVFQRFREIVGDEAGFVPCGYVALVGEGDREALAHNIRMQQENGAPTSLLEPGELKGLMPDVNVEDVVAAAYEPESGYADPVLTCQAFANGARERGALIWPNTPVHGILRDAQGVAGVETSRGTIATRRVVLCTGVWTPILLGPLGVDLPITAIREEMTVFEQPPGAGAPLAMLDLIQLMYLRPEIHDLVLVGSTDHRHLPSPVDPDSYQEGAGATALETAVTKLVHRFPTMADGRVRRGYAGLYDVTPDLNPIFEETPVAGLFVAAGFSGHGFKLAPAVGALMAELVTEGTTRRLGIDVDFFSSRRYAEGRPIAGQHVYRQARLRY